MLIDVRFDLPAQRVAEIMPAAIQYSRNWSPYRCRSMRLLKAGSYVDVRSDENWCTNPDYYDCDIIVIEVTILRDSKVEIRTINEKDIRRGFRVLAKNYPKYFKSLWDETYTDTVGDNIPDMWLQYVVFGKLIASN